MTLRELLQSAASTGNQRVLDYTICLSQFFVVKNPNTEEDMTVCADFPVLGIASCDEEKEIRFVMTASDLNLIKCGESKIIHIVDQKMAEERDKK